MDKKDSGDSPQILTLGGAERKVWCKVPRESRLLKRRYHRRPLVSGVMGPASALLTIRALLRHPSVPVDMRSPLSTWHKGISDVANAVLVPSGRGGEAEPETSSPLPPNELCPQGETRKSMPRSPGGETLHTW